MKLIKKLLDKLHQLVGKLQTAVTKHEEKSEGVRQGKLYKLRLNRGLAMLGIPPIKMGPGHIRYSNYRLSLSREESLWNSLRAEAIDKRVETRLKPAFSEAMKVELPPTTANKLKTKTRKIHKKIRERVQGKGSLVLKVLVVVFIVLMLLWGLVALFSSKRTETIENNNSQQNAPTITCPAGHWQMQTMPEDNKDLSWFAGGLDEINTANNPQTAKDAFNVWLNGRDGTKSSSQDYGVKSYHNLLMATSKAFQISADDSAISKDGECANDATVQLVHEIELARAQGTTEAGIAPNTGYNTGVENKQVFGYSTTGVGGDRRAIKITLKNGTVIWILGQCGNVMTKEDTFRHRDHDNKCERNCHKEKPKCKGNECLTPKSSNPRDYKQHGDDNTRDSGKETKPKATVSTPAESTPPKVNTSQTGGGGVTDSSTNKPGSETGTKAKGASPAPSTPTTKPNEGGTNNGTVTD